MKSIFRLLLSLLLITASIGIPQFAAAQCGLTGFTEPGVPANLNPPCGTFASVNVGPGTQTSFQVLNGASYTFSTCNSAWDTEMTGRNAANTQQFYNDDNGPICATTRASVTWTAGYTGTVFAIVTRFACQLGNSSGGVSAILQYRQNNNLLFTSSAANMCPAETRTLFATPTGGAFSGTGVSGTTFTAPSSGPVVITYTYGTCSTTQTINIDAPQSAPTGATASPATICSGSSVLTASGGTLGTGGTYQWYAGGCGAGAVLGTGSSITVTPLSTTNYFVRITGACSTTLCVQTTVNVSSASTDPTGIGTNNNNFCPGGSATLTVQGGSLGTGATWRWYSGTCCAGPVIGSGASITVTPATTTAYFVRAEGAACGNSNEATVTINVNTVSTAPTGIASSNGTTFCNGLGTTVLSVQGGSLGTGAQWNWYSGTCGGTFISAGTSSITVNPTSNTTYFVRAEGTCPPPTACAQVTINVSAGLAITSISKTDVTCNGANDGTATVNVTGGQTPYTYTWSPGSGGATRTGLAPASYDVTVTDAIGCTATGNVVINQPPLLQVTAVTKTDISCNGANDGTITITAIGGTGALEYTINSFGTTQPSNQFTGLGVGGYTIGVIDANGCTAVYNANPVTINQPAPLAIAVTSTTDASCSGVNNGSITVSASGGTGGYQYSLNGSPFQIGTVFGNLSAGTYTLFAQDNSGCLASVDDTLLNITFVALTVDTSYDVTCAGNADGGFEVSLSNGVSPYQYSINGITYQASGAFTGLSGGTYTVLGRDAAGCQDVVQVTISEAPALVAVIDSVNNLTCNGSGTGGVFISVSGGTAGQVPTYNPLAGNVRSASGLNDGSFSTLSGGALTGRPAANGTCCSAQDPPTDIYEFTVTTSGSYTINNDYTTIFDGFMLLYTDPLDWTVNPPATFVDGNDNCLNFLNSCVTVTLTAGQTYYLVTTRATGTNTTETWNTTFTGPGSVLEVTGFAAGYTYVWSNGAISQDIDSVPAGTYTVTVTDGNGCSTTVSTTITQPLPLTVSLANLAEVRCNGASDGEVDITVTGGTPPYSFVWSNGTLTEDNTNLVAGTYDVTVTDASGCTTTDSYTLGEPTVISVTGTTVNASCGSSTTGSVDVTVFGGVGPYTYFWSNGQTTEDITGLSAGVYTIQVQDSRNCISSASFTVGGGASFAVTIDTVINILCYGDTTGSIEISLPGTGYTFVWSNGDVTQNLTNVGAGTYTVTVSDGTGCQAVATATITQPSPFVASATATNVTCNGSANGAIDVTVNGGLAQYTYAWSNGATSQDLTGLAGGTYTATITDANGCSINVSATVTEPVALSVQGFVLDVNCNGGNNGIVNVSVSGGVPSYTYAWSNGGTSSAIFNLTAGNYDVTATDANGCTVSQTFTVVEPPVFSVTVTGTDVSCNGGSDGTVTVTLPGGSGSGPYTYNWSTGDTSQNLTNVDAGTYTVVVTNANGCTAVGTYTVTEPTVISATETVVNVSCNGGADGSISISISGGTSPYDVAWSNGVTLLGTTTSLISNLAAGTYTATITDANGCVETVSYTVTQPNAITAFTTVTNTDCNGAATGAINLTVSGGTSPYTFIWSNGATTEDLTGLAAGTYTVTITDANGCTATTGGTVTEPTAIVVQGSVVDASCNGAADGDIYVTASGGTGVFTYLWSNAATSQNLINVAAGTYSVTVTDANGCSATDTYTIADPAAVTSTLTVTDVLCFGSATGSVDLTPAGGVAPYRFLWSNFSVSEDLANVAAGTYVVVITDANGCTSVDTAVVGQNPQLAISGTESNVTCFGANDGSVQVVVSGGVGPYTYAWSSGGTADLEQGLAPSIYTVTATDNVGCTIVGTYTITGPAEILGSGIVTNVTCNGSDNGAINVTVAGGTAPYTFLWSNNATTEDVTGLAAATYSYTLTDANGCQFSDTFDVTQPDSLLTSITNIDANCNGASNGSASLTVTGGTGPYTYFWSNFRFTQDIYGLGADEYFVLVTDANGCQTVDSVTIGEPTLLTVTGSAKGAGCGNEARGAVDITVSGGTTPYTFLWSTGAITEDITGLGTGTYCVTITDDNGCQAFFCAVVSAYPLPVANFSASLACDDQEVTFTNSSSITAGSLSYFWDFGDGDTTSDQDPIHIYSAPGTYSVSLIATSSEGCSDTLVQSLVVNPTPDPTITANGLTGSVCSGDSVLLEAPTGAGYSYLWSNGDTTQTITVYTSGTYGVVITSSALCNGVGEIEVGVFSEASVTISQDTTVSLGYSTTLEATGGIAYEWSPSTTLDNPVTGTPVATPFELTTYSVTVTVSDGCVTTREVTVTVDEDFRVDVPNLFTPNGDGINDYLVIQNIFTYQVNLMIFNRWGTEVYASSAYQNDWNGTNDSGDNLTDGTYYYVITVGSKVYKGAITILR
jgi:gliding motility-associated-like protein